jgi:hypothetical protein
MGKANNSTFWLQKRNAAPPVALSAFITAVLIEPLKFGYAKVMELASSRHMGQLNADYPDVPTWLLAALVFSVLLPAILWVAKRRWDVYISEIKTPPPRKLDVLKPGSLVKFSNDTALRFRAVQSEDDIAELAKTEKYFERGEMVGQTNVPQVTEWWRAYPPGNYLMTYRGDVIGGIDIWPLKRSTFESFCQGTREENSITSRDFADFRSKLSRASYWYVASISIKPPWVVALNPLTLGMNRHELVLRLIVNGLENWLRTGAIRPKFPAYFCAEAWTSAGRNLLVKSGFTVPKNSRSETRFSRCFVSEAEIHEVLVEWKRLLTPQTRDAETLSPSSMPPSR